MVNGSACYKARVLANGIALPARTDVAILGGGFAGCATAWALRARGVDAIVLEREASLGRYASGRGAGLGRQLAEDDATSQLVIRGAALLRTQFSAAWAATGGVLCFDDARHAQEYVARAARLGVACEVLDRRGVLAHWPEVSELPLVSALHVPSDGVIDAGALLQQFAADAHVVYEAPVTAVVEGRVTTTRGEVAAQVIVDATGAWAGALTGDPPLDTYKRHLFVLEATARATTPYLWHLGREELYVRADADGILTSACDGEVTVPADQQPDPEADARLRARLAGASSTLAGAGVVRRWACQ
nr:FAD-binding oxidoreductase [Myxococcota bacterium]